MSEMKTEKKQTLLWIVVAVVSALVAVATVAAILRRYGKKKECDVEPQCISYDFSPEEVAFDDEFSGNYVVDITDEIEQAK